MIYLRADGRKASVTKDEPITVGSSGMAVDVSLSGDYDGLAVMLVFLAGTEKVTVAYFGGGVEVPPEVLAVANTVLYIGVFAKSAEGEVVMPTVWANVGTIRASALPDDFTPADPTPDWAAQVQLWAQEAHETAEALAEDVAEWGVAEEGRADAESARVAAETARALAENDRADAETARAGAESSRVQAEYDRDDAESLRASMEALRVQAEGERELAESARATAEGDRADAETERIDAESLRASAESIRTSAESQRVANERERIANEHGRVTAEQARVAAEQARAEAEIARSKFWFIYDNGLLTLCTTEGED